MTVYDQSSEHAAAELFEACYGDLLKIAQYRRSRHAVSDSFLTQDVLHESYIRVSNAQTWQNEQHFKNSMNIAIRHVIIDHARRKLAQKNGGKLAFVELKTEDLDQIAGFSETPEQIVMIADVMQKLERDNPRWMQIIDARYFGGLSEEETAELLGVSTRTVRRDWQAARQWLALSLGVSE